MTEIKYYGWRRDIPDIRDYKYVPKFAGTAGSVDLRTTKHLPKVAYDQGRMNSCTGNTIAAAMEYEQKRQRLADFMPSRLFIYNLERVMEGTLASDGGAAIRDGLKVVSTYGVCEEKYWDYSTSNLHLMPNAIALKRAVRHRALQYLSVEQDLAHLKDCLNEGFPIIYGQGVYASFESVDAFRTGIINMPASGERLVGGHAVLCIGYDDASKRFLVLNSWGPGWGMNGCFTIPYDYLANRQLANDFWTIRLISKPSQAALPSAAA